MTSTLPVVGDAPLQLYIIANQRAFCRSSPIRKKCSTAGLYPVTPTHFRARTRLN
jgi:hypothetical protein